jgi:hypothetical protein
MPALVLEGQPSRNGDDDEVSLHVQSNLTKLSFRGTQNLLSSSEVLLIRIYAVIRVQYYSKPNRARKL